MTTLTERLVDRLARPISRRSSSRRGFLGGSVLVGAALAVNPFDYLFRPGSAYASVCGSGSACADGWSVFCCTINAGRNTCPPDTFVGGWWKADNSSFCGGTARYYIDCNAYRDGHWTCRCNDTTCDQRRVACNQFRYGQCNLQIPYSNTGPVVCRVVSCTPPWQQFAGVCSATSATDNATATHSAPCLTGQPPVGQFDSAVASGSVVTLTGWAFDPDAPTTSINVLIYQDGKPFTTYPARVLRADVNAAYQITGNHGFVVTFRAAAGVHTYSAYALNIAGGSGNPLLGSRSVAVNVGHAPTGHLDSVTAIGSSVRLTGWALDQDEPTTSLQIGIYDGARLAAAFRTNVVRTDVNRAFGVTGSHGFDVTIPVDSGAHLFGATAVGVGGGASWSSLGQLAVTVNPGSAPVGRLDSALPDDSPGSSSVVLRGWAYDDGRPDEPVRIVVAEDGACVTTGTTGRTRRDINDHYAIGGSHGFEIEVPTTSGAHHYEVYAVDRTGAVRDICLGARSVAVGGSAPVGHVERIAVIGGLVHVSGWVLHPDRPGESLPVALHVDGSPVGTSPADRLRPDVAETYGVAAEHGFEISRPLVSGAHTVAVYAMVPGSSRPVPLTGTREVQV